MQGWSIWTVESDNIVIAFISWFLVELAVVETRTRQRQQRLRSNHQTASAVGIDSDIVLQYTTGIAWVVRWRHYSTYKVYTRPEKRKAYDVYGERGEHV
jgi:hypothetical protein